ncbi:barbed-end actin filament uncapping, partial [Homalodisca vitripennis]
NLCNFLAQPNQITHLDISGTDCTLETIFGALLRGCATNLVHLNVSKNAFSTKKVKEVPPSFKQFFTSTLSLKYLNMSYCKLPLEALNCSQSQVVDLRPRSVPQLGRPHLVAALTVLPFSSSGY